MLPTSQVSPYADAEVKVALIQPRGKAVLDTCGGLGYFAASLALVITITAAYHLGYERYRDVGVREPETGNILISMPMLLTANPVGSVLDHSAMHVAAVIHEYEGDTRLPPQTDAE